MEGLHTHTVSKSHSVLRQSPQINTGALKFDANRLVLVRRCAEPAFCVHGTAPSVGSSCSPVSGSPILTHIRTCAPLTTWYIDIRNALLVAKK